MRTGPLYIEIWGGWSCARQSRG